MIILVFDFKDIYRIAEKISFDPFVFSRAFTLYRALDPMALTLINRKTLAQFENQAPDVCKA